VTQEFDHMYDRNHDGFVDKTDIQAFKKKLRSYVEMINQTAVKNVYSISYDDYWELMHEFADTNKDGRLSREEWVEVWTQIVDSAKDKSFSSLPQWVQMMPTSLFPVIDTKGDKIIDPEEYRLFWFHVGGYPNVDDRTLQLYFASMTEDGKYPLTLQRVQELYADFYLSPDPSSPGKYIAGPFDYKNTSTVNESHL